MNRGKDDEKIMGPMFPRLNVNDTEKGGPRAPPRNKMALYEQLSIPSQRYSIGAMPLNPNNSSSLLSSTTTNQGMRHESNMYFPPYEPPPAPYDELLVCKPDAVSSPNIPTQVESRRKPVGEDNFLPGLGQCNDKTRNTHLSSNNSMVLLRNGDKQTTMSSCGGLISKHVIKRDGRNLRISDGPTRPSDRLNWEKDDGTQSENTFACGAQEKQRLSSLEKTDACLCQDHENSVLPAEIRRNEGAAEMPLGNTRKGISLKQRRNPCLGYEYKDAHEVDKGMPSIENDNRLGRENMDRGNDVSEYSMVDFVSGMDISPDDVVGVIGRKQFWNARSAIVNQQRVLAVQVFELHRLIKVQRHIAGSPNLLLEGSSFLGKTSPKDSSVKQYSSEYGVKALAHAAKQKENSQKPVDKMEGTAENAVGKLPVISELATQPEGHPSLSVNPVSLPPVNTDPKMIPWGFQQPAAHQWLVPVMSPSEGLVYKPCPAPGLMGPVCGGCGPPGPTPVIGNMMNQPYGMPNPHYLQGMGLPPAIHFGGQGYFPTYAMRAMSASLSGSAVDQMNPFPVPNPYGQMCQPAAGSANQSLQYQSSCSIPCQKNGVVATSAATAPPPKEGELQGSTASSPSGRAKGTGMVASLPTKGGDALSVLPAAPTNENSNGAPPTEKPSRVIRVVPHNPKSTQESAARIFQSIQAERQQYEFN